MEWTQLLPILWPIIFAIIVGGFSFYVRQENAWAETSVEREQIREQVAEMKARQEQLYETQNKTAVAVGRIEEQQKALNKNIERVEQQNKEIIRLLSNGPR